MPNYGRMERRREEEEVGRNKLGEVGEFHA